jgi:hypothetical protein
LPSTNDLAYSPIGPYNYAKTEGERAVWSHVVGKNKPYTVACINPTMVFGACLAKPHAKASPFIFRQALYGNDFYNRYTAMCCSP